MDDKKVLLIDDDTDFLHLAGLLFHKEGAQIFTAVDGLDGLIKLFVHRPDLIILDVKMPGIDGYEVCERIQEVSDTPIIMVTAVNDEQGMLRGLESGADDFLSKPFNPIILLARAKAILRRNGNHEAPKSSYEDYSHDHLSFEVEKRNVILKGKRIKLSPVEFRLLVYLARNAGKVLTYDHIRENVWGAEHPRDTDHIHVYISQLRRKLEENPRDPRFILTVHGIGYIFERDKLSPAGTIMD